MKRQYHASLTGLAANSQNYGDGQVSWRVRWDRGYNLEPARLIRTRLTEATGAPSPLIDIDIKRPTASLGNPFGPAGHLASVRLEVERDPPMMHVEREQKR